MDNHVIEIMRDSVKKELTALRSIGCIVPDESYAALAKLDDDSLLILRTADAASMCIELGTARAG